MSKRVTYTCNTCKQYVDDGQGYLAVSISEASDRVHHRRAATARTSGDGFSSISMEDLMAGPGDARWRVFHTTCDPEPEGNSYTYEVHRARTAEQLLARTLHLQGKNWYDGTDWADFVRRSMADAGCPLSS
jgi:hypothetical protein